MRVAIPKETRPGETRVAATPESIKKLKGLGLEMVVQAGAGAGAKIADADYLAAGATIAPDAASTVRDADIVLMVRGPQGAEIANIKNGAIVAALLSPHTEQDNIAALASAPGSPPSPWNCCRAFQPRPVDGRTVEPGQPRRLQGGGGCGGHLRPRHADDDDRGGHHCARRVCW